MSCKVQKIKNSVEGGNRSYFQVIFDFSSLEARLAAIDTYLNEQGLDPVLYDIYKDGGSGDLHSTTGFNTFAKGRKCYHIVDDETGEEWRLDELSKLEINRNGQTMTVKASELQPTDKILGEV